MKQAHSKHLAQFKIPQSLLDAARVESVTDAQAREKLGINTRYENDLGGIYFPYVSPITGRRTGARIRLDHPLDSNGNGKYISEQGCRSLFFPPLPREPGDEAPAILNNTEIPVLIVEAEKSALALTALAQRMKREMLVVAIGGCWGWRRKTGNKLLPDGSKEVETGPSPDFDLINFDKRQTVIAFDSNAEINPDVKRARFALARELAQRKAKVALVNIPAEPNINGPDDLIAAFGDQRTAEVFQNLVPFSKDAIPLIVMDLIDFKVASFPLREPFMLVGNTTVFSARSLNQIFAWRGTGKTMVACALAGAMATGGKFLNLQATRPIKILYVEGESPNAQLQERTRVLTEATEHGYFRMITLDNQVSGIPSLTTAEGRLLVENAIGDAEAIFLDSISTLASMPTNEEEEWLGLLEWFCKLRSRGLCTTFLHHAGKTGMQRGHSRSEDMLDISIKLTRAPEDEEVDWLKVKLEYDKFRGERVGIRTLSVECKGGLWTHATLETEKLNILKDYLDSHPSASSRSIAKDCPDLGSHNSIAKLLRKLKGL